MRSHLFPYRVAPVSVATSHLFPYVVPPLSHLFPYRYGASPTPVSVDLFIYTRGLGGIVLNESINLSGKLQMSIAPVVTDTRAEQCGQLTRATGERIQQVMMNECRKLAR